MIDLFDHAARRQEAEEAKRKGMAQSEQNADLDWSAYMLKAVRLTCLEQPDFTSDDVFDRQEADPHAPTTHDSRAFGPIMIRAAKLGYCEHTDRVLPSRRKSLHASPRAIWKSLIYRP